MDLKPGDRVLYVPSRDHWADRGPDGLLFEFVHARNHPPYAEGEVADPKRLGRIYQADRRAGTLKTLGGYELRCTYRPLTFWPATVRAVAAGGKLHLDVAHPGGSLRHYDDVPRDPGRGPHSYHLPPE
jgi:hypothetical protein